MKHYILWITFLFSVGFTACLVSADCNRPNFTDPYAIIISPDESVYTLYDYIELSCEEGHTNNVPDYSYCLDDGSWEPDPSAFICLAQCNITELDSNLKATDQSGTEQSVFDHGSVASFSCATLGQFTGSDSAACENGTFSYVTEPSCLAFCPEPTLSEGLTYFTPNDAINDTNSLYYLDGTVITFSCDAGYDEPECTTNCQSTCDDGVWNPETFPTCGEADECSSMPCLNNGTCEDGFRNFTCFCVPGFTDTFCETDINECASDPCQNGGTCIDQVNSFICNCEQGFGGLYCENGTEPVTTDMSTVLDSTYLPTETTQARTYLQTSPSDQSTTLPTDRVTGAPTSPEIPDTGSTVTNVATAEPNSTIQTTPHRETTPAIGTTATFVSTSRTTAPVMTTRGSGTTPTQSMTSGIKTSPQSTTTVEPPVTEGPATEESPTTSDPCESCDPEKEVCNVETRKCDCRTTLYRDEQDNTCKEWEPIEVEMRITQINGEPADYTDDLADPESVAFKEMEEDVCEPFDSMYGNTGDYIECKVLTFTEGSIIVNYALIFVENSTENTTTVEDTIQDELTDPDGAFSDIAVDNTSLVVVVPNACDYSELNDCSSNAICTNTGDGKFECNCKEGYTDTLPSRPGRECTLITEGPPVEPTEPEELKTTVEPVIEEPLDAWVIPVAVCVPIVVILLLAVVALCCWQIGYVKGQGTKQAKGGIYDVSSIENELPPVEIVMNGNGAVHHQEEGPMGFPWHSDIPTNDEGEFIFASADTARPQSSSTIPMADYPNDYATPSPFHDPYDNYGYN